MDASAEAATSEPHFEAGGTAAAEAVYHSASHCPGLLIRDRIRCGRCGTMLNARPKKKDKNPKKPRMLEVDKIETLHGSIHDQREPHKSKRNPRMLGSGRDGHYMPREDGQKG